MPSGDLPAVWPVGGDDLDQCSLAVRPEKTDLPYGHLHFETTQCPDEDQAERLALLVTKRGALLRFVKTAAQ